MRSVVRKVLMLPLAMARGYARLISRLVPSAQTVWLDRAYDEARNRTALVTHQAPGGEVSLTFLVPNEVCRYRAETVSTKEPETLEWLDRFGGDGVLFDIGANVGIYSIYYAKTHPGRVYAFEPSALNLGLLARNISANEVTTAITIVPTPLTDVNLVASFQLTMLDEGGAMSTFGEDLGHDGAAIRPKMSYETTGVTLDCLIETGIVADLPTMIKLDVDGIEHLILRGARATLDAPSLRTVLIEVNDRFTVLADEVEAILTSAGFSLVERRHAAMFDGGEFATTFNQIWVRDR